MLETHQSSLVCPLPSFPEARVTMAHGGGGSLMRDLIDREFVPQLGNPLLNRLHDATTFGVEGVRMAMTTDSYVVQPLEFPGGNIGSLAVFGTVNDLAMSGARPLYLSAAFILEEGLPIPLLQRIVGAMRVAADASGIQVITGDTKVIERRGGDGLMINTAGVGVVHHTACIGPQSIEPGDIVLVNGDLGRHGIAVMTAREGLEFETTIPSDSAPLNRSVHALLDANVRVHCMRDLTRGGLATAVNELAEAAGVTLVINETDVPVRQDVRGVCELLGLDPLYVANEGRFLAVVAEADAEHALQVMAQSTDTQPRRIGTVEERESVPAILTSSIGAPRVLDVLSGEQLPRIC